MKGVHAVVVVLAVITVSVVLELTRRRQLRPKYGVVWLAVSLVIVVFAIDLRLFDWIAHGLGISSPPALLTVCASLFLLIVCVYLSWEVGRLEDKTRLLAEEVSLLRKSVDDLARLDSIRLDNAPQDGVSVRPRTFVE